MGTADYMAPEQAEDSHAADHRSDIYSLGCTLYFLLTAKVPFPEKTVLKRMMAHMQRPAPSLSAGRPDVTPALEAVYQKMMAKRPDDRPWSMTELIALWNPARWPAAAAAQTLKERTEAEGSQRGVREAGRRTEVGSQATGSLPAVASPSSWGSFPR